jgi:hypothetical protein
MNIDGLQELGPQGEPRVCRTTARNMSEMLARRGRDVKSLLYVLLDVFADRWTWFAIGFHWKGPALRSGTGDRQRQMGQRRTGGLRAYDGNAVD